MYDDKFTKIEVEFTVQVLVTTAKKLTKNFTTGNVKIAKNNIFEGTKVSDLKATPAINKI